MTRLAEPLHVAPIQEQPAIALMRPDVVDFGVLLGEGTRAAWPRTERLFAEHRGAQAPHRMPPQRQVVQVRAGVVRMGGTAATADQRATPGRRTEPRRRARHVP